MHAEDKGQQNPYYRKTSALLWKIKRITPGLEIYNIGKKQCTIVFVTSNVDNNFLCRKSSVLLTNEKIIQ